MTSLWSERISYYTGFLSPSQAVESLWAVVSLCDSADEELRHVAMETLLTFGEWQFDKKNLLSILAQSTSVLSKMNLIDCYTGEEGRLAYEQLDTMPREMVRLGTRRGNAVTTAFWNHRTN